MSRRTIARKEDIDLTIRQDILKTLFNTGLRIYANRGDSKRLRYDIQQQLQWLFNQFIMPGENLGALVEEYGARIEAATAGYDFSDIPDF